MPCAGRDQRRDADKRGGEQDPCERQTEGELGG
jgi:hypothetical protein